MSDWPSHDAILARVGPARAKWGPSPPPGVTPEPAGPGEESVWSYPRPPVVRDVRGEVVVHHAGVVVARSTHALRVLETAGAPVPYLPPDDVRVDLLRESHTVTLCEWKGAARHYDLHVGTVVVPDAAFTYPDPLRDLGQGYEAIAGWFGFYPGKLDTTSIGGVIVRPQPGGVYAGWVTPDIRGPIKGEPGTGHW